MYKSKGYTCLYQHYMNVYCDSKWYLCFFHTQGTTFKALNFQDKVLTAKDIKDKKLKEVLTVFHVMDQRIIYKLHKYFTEVSVNRSYAEIARLQRDIQVTSQYAPGGKASITWPIGRQPPFKAQSRFDVFGWEYFTMTHIYAITDIESKVPLTGAHKQDIDEIVTTAMGQLNDKYEKAFTLGRLVNGYRRFDPTRGMEYTLDLELKMTAQKKTIQKRVPSLEAFWTRWKSFLCRTSQNTPRWPSLYL